MSFMQYSFLKLRFTQNPDISCPIHLIKYAENSWKAFVCSCRGSAGHNPMIIYTYTYVNASLITEVTIYEAQAVFLPF